MVERVAVACLRGAGDMVSGLIVMAIVNVINMVTSYSLCRGIGPLPELGWTGIALGTAIGHCSGAAILLTLLACGRAGFHLRPSAMRPDVEMIRRILRIGIPGGFDVVLVTICHLVYLRIVLSLGDMAAAAHGVAIQVEALGYMPGGAFQISAATMAGQYIGAHDLVRARRSVVMACVVATAVMVVAGIFFYVAATPLAALFLKGGSQQVIPLAARLLRIVAYAMAPLALVMVLVGALRRGRYALAAGPEPIGNRLLSCAAGTLPGTLRNPLAVYRLHDSRRWLGRRRRVVCRGNRYCRPLHPADAPISTRCLAADRCLRISSVEMPNWWKEDGEIGRAIQATSTFRYTTRMIGFNWLLDGSIVGVYLLVTMAAGLAMRRYVGRVDDFLVAGREMDVFLGIASLAATEFGIVTCMYAAENGYRYGFAGATPGILMAIAMLVVGLTGFCIKPLRDSGVITIPELIETQFGPRIRWASGVVIVLGGLLNMGVFLRVGGEFLVNVAGLDVKYLEIMMTALLVGVAVYTIFGGMLSVLITDFLQFIVMSAGLLAVTLLILANVGWQPIVDAVESHYGAGDFNPFVNEKLGWSYVVFNGLLNFAVVLTWQTTIAHACFPPAIPKPAAKYTRARASSLSAAF